MKLLNVLPPQSGLFLPQPYRELMTNETSPLRQVHAHCPVGTGSP